jgi:hypothetical protein
VTRLGRCIHAVPLYVAWVERELRTEDGGASSYP